MYSVYYLLDGSDDALLFISSVPDACLATRIAGQLMDDFAEVIDIAWAEQD